MRNNIFHEDCLDGIVRVETRSVKLIIADPPYFQGLTHNGSRGSFVDLAICKPFFRLLFQEYKRVLCPDGQVYFFSDWRGYAFYYPLFDAFLGCDNLIVWDKMSGPGTRYRFQHEFILWHAADPLLMKSEPNVWRSKGFAAGAKTTNGEKLVETQKTKELIGKIVLENTQPGELVLDTFGGSGTTAVVCRENGRDYIVFELDEENYWQSLRRADRAVQPGLFNK